LKDLFIRQEHREESKPAWGQPAAIPRNDYSAGWSNIRRSSAATVMEQASPHSIAQSVPEAANLKRFKDFANMNLHRVRVV